MSDETIVELLDRAAARVPASEPPLTELLQTGRRDLLRRRTAVLSGVVATIVAVAGVGAVARTMRGGDHATLPATAGPPAPPDGMRWVGIGRTVVAVPRTWSMWPGLYCGSFDGHDHVTILTSFAAISCGQVPPGIPAGGVIELREERGLDVEVDLTGPALNDLRQQVASTRTTLPSGWLAIPAAASLTGTGTPKADDEARALEAAGFQVSRVTEPAWGVGPGVRTDPAIGTPTRVGSSVIVYERVPSPAVASLSGRLLWVGGPAPGSPTPHSGTIHIVGTGADEGLDEYVPVGKDGHWSFEGPAGTFTVTGSSPGYLGADGAPDACRAQHRVTLRWETTEHVDVLCQLR